MNPMRSYSYLALLFGCSVAHDLGAYESKTLIASDEENVLNQWVIIGSSSDEDVTSHSLQCPTRRAPCLYFPGYTNATATLSKSTTGFTDIELVWDMRSFVERSSGDNLLPTIQGRFSCDGSTFNDLFIIDWSSALDFYKDGVGYVGINPPSTEYFLDQDFKLPESCNQQQITVQIEIQNALSLGQGKWADFSIDNFCIYGNPVVNPTKAPITRSPASYNTSIFPSLLSTERPTDYPTANPSISPIDCTQVSSLSDADNCTEPTPEACSILIESSLQTCFSDPYKNQRSKLWNDIKQCICKNIFAEGSFDDDKKKCYIEKYHYGNLVQTEEISNDEISCELQYNFEIETGIYNAECAYVENVYHWILEQRNGFEEILMQCQLLSSKTEQYPNGYGAIVSGYFEIHLRDENGNIQSDIVVNANDAISQHMLAFVHGVIAFVWFF